jgi:hypothetical protein
MKSSIFWNIHCVECRKSTDTSYDHVTSIFWFEEAKRANSVKQVTSFLFNRVCSIISQKTKPFMMKLTGWLQQYFENAAAKI